MALAYLFEPTTQFQARTGANLTAGFLKVFYTQTDDAAETYSDFAATPNEEEIVLDADGRAVVIVDDTKTYRLEVYNRNRGLLFTIDPITAMGGGGGGSMVYRVISTDGTVAIETTTSGGITYYDLSTAFTNEASNWGFRGAQIDSLDGSNDWQELSTVSTMGNVPYSFGWKATKDTAYDFAASVELPAGIAGAICGIDVRCDFQVDGVTVDTETGYIDPSRNVDRVSFEFKGQVSEDQKVDAKLYARCAEALTGTLVGRVFYNEECDGIVGGSAPYTAGDYVEITSAKVINVTGVQPLSGMSSYVEKSAFDDCCSAMSGYVSSLSSQVSSLETSVTAISSTVSGLTGTYVEISSISGYSSIWNSASAVPNKLDESAFTAYTSTAQAFTGVTTDSTLTGNGMAGSALGVNKMELVFDETMNTSVSGNSAIVGVNSAIMSGKLDNSASSTWYPMTGNPSGFLTEHQNLSGYVEKSSISAESSQWNDVSSKIPWSALSGDGTKVTGISGSAIGATYSAGEYIDISADTISVTGLQPVSGMSAYVEQSAFDDCCSAMSGYVSSLQNDMSSISSTVSGLTGTYVEISSISAQSSQWNEVSGLSGKLDNSASSTWYPYTGNPSGFLTEHQDLSGYVEKSSISAESSNWNEVSAMMPWSALSGDGTSITSISGSSIKGHEYTGIAPIVVDNTAETIAMNYSGLALDSSMSATASGGDIVIGVAGGIFLEASALGTGVI
jgi:hypothetical protein